MSQRRNVVQIHIYICYKENFYEQQRELFVLILCYIGMMLFWIKYLDHGSINLLHGAASNLA